jgi:opacity protein-like surface antigen
MRRRAEEPRRPNPGAKRSKRRRAIAGAGLVGALLILLLGGDAAAAGKDWNRTDDPLLGAVGVHAGKIGGTGLSLKFPIVWWLYVQGAGAIWNTSNDKRHNYGLEAQYLLRQDRNLRLFLATGAGRYYHKKTPENAREEVDAHWNYGFGVGTEFLLTERWSLQVELDFTHDGDDDTFTLFPQVGTFFYW